MALSTRSCFSLACIPENFRQVEFQMHVTLVNVCREIQYTVPMFAETPKNVPTSK